LGNLEGRGDVLGGSLGSFWRLELVCFCGLGLGFEGGFGLFGAVVASVVDVAVVLDSVVLLDGRGGCAQGGMDSATGVLASGCCVAPEGFTAPLRVLFLPAIAAAWCV
jgi:hypothetical protein